MKLLLLEKSIHWGFHSVLTQHRVKITGSRGLQGDTKMHAPSHWQNRPKQGHGGACISQQPIRAWWKHHVSRSVRCGRHYLCHHFSSQLP